MANELPVVWSCRFSGVEKKSNPKNWRLGPHEDYFMSGDKQLKACFTDYNKAQRNSRLQDLAIAPYGVKAHREQERLILSLQPGALTAISLSDLQGSLFL